MKTKRRGQMADDRKLVAVRCGSKRHLDLIRAGYRVHHLDGQIVWMLPGRVKPV